MRYLVASHRYEITKQMREILVVHFEDGFQTPEAVETYATQLRATTMRTTATMEKLLAVRQGANQVTSIEASQSASSRFDRTWTLQPDRADVDVLGFSAWAALLLHLMVHKAHCVLYHPLYRDPEMVANEGIRKR
jgi:hypothetical protein